MEVRQLRRRLLRLLTILLGQVNPVTQESFFRYNVVYLTAMLRRADTMTFYHEIHSLGLALILKHFSNELDCFVRVEILHELLVEAFINLVHVEQVIHKVEQKL